MKAPVVKAPLIDIDSFYAPFAGMLSSGMNHLDAPLAEFDSGTYVLEDRLFKTQAPAMGVSRMDLQWFAAEDEGRTEDPTEYKIRKAREEGRLAKSQELTGALVLLLPALSLLILAPYLLRTFVEMMRFFLSRAVEIDPTKDAVIVQAFFHYFIRLALPVVLVAVVSAVFANLVQTGPNFSLHPLIPNFSKIVPRFGAYFRRTLPFSAEGMFNLAKNVVKMVIIGIVAFLTIRSRVLELTNLQKVNVYSAFTLVASLAIRMIITVALLLLALSIPDLIFQRWQYKESLKMTKQEVKEERKMYEGDPLIRARLRQKFRELVSKNLAVNVPKADVVITNPTHFAVALEYNRETMQAPMVSAKGADEVAFRIRRIAEENGVPLVENKPLARELFAKTNVGDIIPENFYQVIAAVLAQVDKINQERRKTAESIGA